MNVVLAGALIRATHCRITLLIAAPYIAGAFHILCVKGGMMARRVAAVENQATAEALKKLIEKCGGRFIGVTPHPSGGEALNVHYDSDNEIDFGRPPSDEDKYN
jgi:hypothetical protein